ncbi:MAG: transposase [Gemmataceae bacterium]
MPVIHELVGDKGFDSDDLRRAVSGRGIMPQLASRSNRDDADLATYPDAYRTRNRIERFFAKLKQFRRIATRYDKLKQPSPDSSNSPADGFDSGIEYDQTLTGPNHLVMKKCKAEASARP